MGSKIRMQQHVPPPESWGHSRWHPEMFRSPGEAIERAHDEAFEASPARRTWSPLVGRNPSTAKSVDENTPIYVYVITSYTKRSVDENTGGVIMSTFRPIRELAQIGSYSDGGRGLDRGVRRRALDCLGEARYQLVEAVSIYRSRHGAGHQELAAITDLWGQLDAETHAHVSGDGPSGHGYSQGVVDRLSFLDCLELHEAEHSGSDPPLHGHEMDPHRGGLRPPGWPTA
jgi:hypothetical protein